AGFAQTATSGTIEGRVFNPAVGEYLENARITVEGTALESFTDSGGQYRLTNVPAGAMRVRAFRTGIIAQTQSVTVIAGGTAQLNFELGAGQRGRASRPSPPGEDKDCNND